MSVLKSTGTGFDIAKTYGSVIAMSAITNAAEAVGTLANGHGLTVGKIVEVSSGWSRLDKRIARVKAVATDDVTFEGINTSNLTFFPAGQGIGSVREITDWDEIKQVGDVDTSGGDQKFDDVTFMTDDDEKQIPTTRSAINLKFTVFDDPTMAFYATVQNASDTGEVAALRMRFRNGATLYNSAYWSMQESPNVKRGKANTIPVNCAYVAKPTRYAS